MPQADLYQCVAATGIVEGFNLAVDGTRFIIDKGKAYLHGQPMTGGFVVDFAGREPGWYMVTAAGETCAAVRGLVEVGLTLALILTGGEGGIRMARDLRQRLLMLIWQQGQTDAIVTMPAACRVLRLQAAVLEQHEGGALWARKIAGCNVRIGDLLPKDRPLRVDCAFAAEHLGALAQGITIEWAEP
jgi:hypothetical protein